MPSVLFVCMANRYRSPLAAALFQRRLTQAGLAGDWRVSSAGLWAEPGLPVLEAVAETARDYGLDLSGHRSQMVSRQLLAGHDLVLVMQASQQEALATEFPELRASVHLLSQAAEGRDYDIRDAATSRQAVAEMAADLDALLQQGMGSIQALAADLGQAKRPPGS